MHVCRHTYLHFVSCAAGSDVWRHPQVAADDKRIEDLHSRVARVLNASNNKCMGTLARIRPDGLCISCRHVLVKNGQFIKATAWGHPLQFVAAWPHDDIIVVQGVTMV